MKHLLPEHQRTQVKGPNRSSQSTREWLPHVTVAALVERDGRYLMVEESPHGRSQLNQPAGHLEEGESLIEAVVRETLEETGYHFTPQSLVGIYRYTSPDSGTSYIRFTFFGHGSERIPPTPIDSDIDAIYWMGVEEIRQERSRHRSASVMDAIEDHLAGRHYPIDLIK